MAIDDLMYHRFESMAVGVELAFWGVSAGEKPRVQELLERAQRDVDSFAQRFTRFDAASELMQLNRERSMVVSPELFLLLSLALAAEQATSGRFNPALGKEIASIGYNTTFDNLSGWTEGNAPTSAHSALSTVTVDAPTRVVTLAHDIHIDLGGIAKGWIADQVTGRYGNEYPMLANIGGDIACTAPPGDQAWSIDVEHFIEGHEAFVCDLEVEWGGVATSGINRRRWRDLGGTEHHHLLDSDTSQSARTSWSAVTVVAESASTAETFSTAMMLTDEAAMREWAHAHELYVVATDLDGRCTVVEPNGAS